MIENYKKYTKKRKEKDMKVLVVPIYANPYVTEFKDFKDIKKFLMGYVEHVTLSESAVLLCNEEGKLRRFTPNRALGDFDIVFGDFVIVGQNEDEEDFCDLSDKDAEFYTKMFADPKAWYTFEFDDEDNEIVTSISPNDEKKSFIYYELLQCDDTPYKFAPYDKAVENSMKLSDYHQVYHSIAPYDSEKSNVYICEKLYTAHNTYISDRRGHSMSISDIIVLHLPEGDKCYYVDLFGFAELDSSAFVSLD